MDVNRAYAKDIRKLNNLNYGRIYNTLSERWGGDSTFPFAKVRPASDKSYVWSDTRDGWRCVSSANSLEREAINDALSRLSEMLHERLGDKDAVFLLTYPSEEYLFYREANGEEMELLVTGWGFRNMPRSPIGRNRDDVVQQKRRRRVFVSFSRGGEVIPHFRFVVKLSTTEKSFETDNDGKYCFENVRLGEQFVLVTSDSREEFNLNVREGVEDYEFALAAVVEPEPPVVIDPPIPQPGPEPDPQVVEPEPPVVIGPPAPRKKSCKCKGCMGLLLVLLMLVAFLFVWSLLTGWMELVILVMSTLSYVLFGLDKRAAVYNKWRFPENLLLSMSVLFGATGSLCGMLLFWHKVRKPKFWIVVGLSFLLHWGLFIIRTFFSDNSVLY